MSQHTWTGATRSLEPITAVSSDSVNWSGAMWIGEINKADLGARRIHFVDGEKFGYARLLVWDGDQPRGFVEVPLTEGAADVAALMSEVEELPQVAAREDEWELPPISVVVCTRDHPEDLRGVLDSLTAVDYPEYEVLVVDNNPTSGLTPPVVASFDDDRVRLVDAAGQGLSIARNVGIQHAKHGVVAFTDDDLVVDRLWLKNLAHGFAEDERVACVCGMAATAEMVTSAQSYFDRRARVWAHCGSAIYDLAAPPEDEPLFPLRVGAFGTGANFAVRTDAVRELGGFDEGLGIGSPTGGGEDVDMFVRVLVGGYLLVREPSAVVWHRHRRTVEELEVQIHNYGLGLGAWAFKLLTRPTTFLLVVRRFRRGLSHIRGVTAVEGQDVPASELGLGGLRRREFVGVLNGPLALANSRIVGRSATPLKSKSIRLLDFRRGQMWGDPGNSIAAGRFSLAAVVLGLLGSLGAVSVLPTFLLVIMVAAFTFLGPGCLALSWYAHLPTSALVPLVPAVSVAASILVVSGLLLLGFYSPVVVLLAMTVATVLGGLFRCGYLARRESVEVS